MKKLCSTLLAAALLLGCCAMPVYGAEAGFGNFQPVGEYADGMFADVSVTDWYRDNVEAAFELGLMQGNGDGSFNAAGNIRLSETLALASRLHSIYAQGAAEFTQGSPWYQVYVDYALANGLLTEAAESYDGYVTRGQFAAILARSLPGEALPQINDIADDRLPDVKMSSPNAEAIYRLYRAGILTGSNERGTFGANDNIQRSAVAAIVTRMAYRSLRVKFTLAENTYPDLPEMPEAGDEFFANSAMLGNSLAQGMMLYSGLRDVMANYSYQSTTVNDPDFGIGAFSSLLRGSYDKVYIEYGTNEIWMAPEAFTEAYGGIIDRIRAAMPGVEIYVMAITPVTAASDSAGSYTMAKVRALNEALYKMCGEKQCWYLDCCEPLCGPDGCQKPEYQGWDGVHMGADGYLAWEKIIRTHYN